MFSRRRASQRRPYFDSWRYDPCVSDTVDISSVQNPTVKRVVKLRKPRERRAAGVLIAEGRREVERALAAGLELRELFVCPVLCDERFGRPCTTVSAAVLSKIAYHDKPEGVLGIFDAPVRSLNDLEQQLGPDSLLLVVVGTEKPGNLGAMVRTAAAAGCAGVLAVGPAVDVFNPNAIRNSTGAVFALPTVVVPTDAEAIAWLKAHGLSVLAALAPDEQAANAAVSCFDADWAFPAAIVVGPEHAGLDSTWRAAADVAVTIPMAVGIAENPALVDSLNASNAAAVLLYEAVRRRSGQ